MATPGCQDRGPCLAVLLGLALALGTAAHGAEQTLLYADFEGGLGGFVIDNDSGDGNGLWHLTGGCEAGGDGHSRPTVLFYGREGLCDYDAGMGEGVVVSPAVSLAGWYPPVRLTFAYWLETECDPREYDMASVEVAANGGPFVPVAHADATLGLVTLADPSYGWKQAEVDLSPFAGAVVQVRFRFRTGDDMFNEFSGFYVDDVRIAAHTEPYLAVVAGASRMAHGAEGEFDLSLAVDGPTAVEMRWQAPTRMVVSFSEPIQAAGGSLEPGREVAVSAGRITALATEGNDLIVDLAEVPSQACLVLTLAGGPDGIVGASGGELPADFTLAVQTLPGDVNGDGTVSVLDLVLVRNVLNQPATAANFKADLDANGLINVLDLVLVRNALNTSVASCP